MAARGFTLLLTTTGRKSGQPRRTALIYQLHNDSCVVVASNGGAVKHPAWYADLVANSSVTVQVGENEMPPKARTVTGSERKQLWKLMTEVRPDYDKYQEKTDREIPVVVLDPV